MAGRHRKQQVRARHGRHRQPPPRSRLVIPTIAAAGVLGIGGYGASAAFNDGGRVAPHPVPRLSAPTLPVPALSLSPTPAPSTTPPRAQRPALPDFAVTAVRGVAWVQILGLHKRPIYAGLVRRGHTVTTTVRPIRVTIGDAGAVRLVLHHHAQLPAGRPGAVITFVVHR